MKNNIINSTRILELCKEIEDSSDEIFENIAKINQLLDLLPNSFTSADSKKICEFVKNEQLLNLKNYCNKIISMKKVLENINLAYVSVDEKFCQKNAG